MVINHRKGEIFYILKILVDSDGKYSIRKLSKLRKINYKSAYNAVVELEKQGVVTVEKLGNTNLCSFNRSFGPLVFAVEYERMSELLKNKDFQVIFKRLNELPFYFTALIFGSYVKKTSDRRSDIDLLIISENGKEAERAVSLIPLNVHLTCLTPKEFMSMANSNEFSVVSEAMKKNIIMIGIEDYYRLLQNVRRK